MKIKGFSILEVMVAVAIMSVLGMEIYRLQLAEISATRQLLTRQLAMEAANNLANQLYAHLNYAATAGRVPGMKGANIYYLEATANLHSSSSSRCTGPNASCNDATYAGYVLSNWKVALANNLNVPATEICAQVCNENPTKVIKPSYISGCNVNLCAACSINCGVYIKIVWRSRVETAESTLNNNFIVMRLPSR